MSSSTSPEATPQSPEQAPPSPDYLPGPEYLEYLAPSDDEIPAEDQSLLVGASPTALSLGYVADSDPEENPEEDLADYPTNGGDNDDEEEESSKDDKDEEEEEEHLALDDSHYLLLTLIRIHVRHHTPPSPSTEALIAEYASAPTPPSPPPSPLSSLSSLLLRIPSPPLLLPPLHTSLTYASAPLGYRAAMVQFEVGESLTAVAARQTGHTLARRVYYGFIDTLDASIRASKGRVMTAVGEVNERVTDLATTQRQDAHELYVRCEDTQDDQALLRAHISLLTRKREREKMASKKTTTPMTDAAIKQLIAQGIADALAKYEATRNSGNGDDSYDLGSCRRTERITRDALTWWNSYVKTVGHDAAYGMTWKTLKKLMTDRYCPRSKIKKLEIEISNLKVNGTDVVSYTQCFQELALMCGRMFPEESDKVGKVQGHYKKYRPKLKNNNRGNPVGNGGAPARAYAVGNARKKSDSNVITGTFLLNNRYASILFDTGAGRSFVSTAYSFLIDIVPTTLDHDYDVELAD
ncbi:putative reverse transcriptase domain-containing protein [Tanacetum coccineum]